MATGTSRTSSPRRSRATGSPPALPGSTSIDAQERSSANISVTLVAPLSRSPTYGCGVSEMSRLRAAAFRRPPADPTVGVLVVVGLVMSGLVNVWIEPPIDGSLPGVALESQTILVIERALVVFAAWLLVLVVCGQALRGRLPIEISGRGVRYADAESAQGSVSETKETLRGMRQEMATVRADVVRLETLVRRQDEC